MNAQNFANLGDYLRDLMHAVNRRAATHGKSAFTVEVREASITSEEAAQLR